MSRMGSTVLIMVLLSGISANALAGLAQAFSGSSHSRGENAGWRNHLSVDPSVEIDRRERCEVQYVPEGYILGCTSSRCDVYPKVEGMKLGCTARHCDYYHVPEGYELGCVSNRCDIYFVPQGHELGCLKPER